MCACDSLGVCVCVCVWFFSLDFGDQGESKKPSQEQFFQMVVYREKQRARQCMSTEQRVGPESILKTDQFFVSISPERERDRREIVSVKLVCFCRLRW